MGPRTPPDLVLLDINLPGHDGLELLRRVRGDKVLARLPVALFCQPGLSAGIAAGWAAGADYLLAKDVVTSPAAWAGRMDEILAHLHGRAGVASLGFPLEGTGQRFVPWGAALNRALDLPPLRSLGVEVIEQLLRRALARGFGQTPSGWLLEGTGRLASHALPPCASGTRAGEQAQRVLSSVVDQLWCLHGSAASRAFAERLRADLAESSGSLGA